MTNDARSRVNAVRITNALTLPIPIIFGLPPNRRFDLNPGDYLDIREEAPPAAYLEVSVDNAEGSAVWVHEWEEGTTEVQLNGTHRPLAPAIRNNNPELRQRGWLGAESSLADKLSVGLFLDDTRAGNTTLRVEGDGKETTYSGSGRAPIWCSGYGVEDRPPHLFVEPDGLRFAAGGSQVVTDY